jgi:predicted nucleic acid-binding protein
MSKLVILDSSALIAQLNVADIWHAKADTTAGFISRTDRQIILPYEVLAETLNRVGNNIGREQAVLAGKAILTRYATGDLVLPQSDPDVLDAALEVLKIAKVAQAKQPSFVDCVVMAYADFYDTDEVFGFDHVFAMNGYRLPGAPATKQAA